MKEYVFRSKYLDFYRHLKKGNLYLNNFEYLKAKTEFTNCINCKNIPKEMKEKIHLLRIITNYNLLENFEDQEIRWDMDSAARDFNFGYRFLRALELDKLGKIENALMMIEDNIIKYEQYQNQFKELSIHLSKELQVILKMRFY